MNLSEIARTRHSCKAFDATRKIPAADWEKLQSLLLNTPSAVNAQPWRFIVTQSEKGRERILKGMTAPHFAANAAKVKNASHLVVMCAKKKLDSDYLNSILEAEDRAGRFASPDARAAQAQGRGFFVNSHQEKGDEAEWLSRQVYISLGMLLLGASTLGIDACPMEGLDTGALDYELGLNESGYSVLLVVALGYRSPDDFNAALPKARLPETSIFMEI